VFLLEMRSFAWDLMEIAYQWQRGRAYFIAVSGLSSFVHSYTVCIYHGVDCGLFGPQKEGYKLAKGL
jgi:hypothetical protein